MSKAEKVLKEIENMTKKQFLPIVGPHKGRTLAKFPAKQNLREFWRLEHWLVTPQF